VLDVAFVAGVGVGHVPVVTALSAAPKGDVAV
jgi:hypothetical protein